MRQPPNIRTSAAAWPVAGGNRKDDGFRQVEIFSAAGFFRIIRADAEYWNGGILWQEYRIKRKEGQEEKKYGFKRTGFFEAVGFYAGRN